jgi:hypothetical protein
METYTVYRYFRECGKEREEIKTGLTLEEAQEHCQRDDTSGEGWFDGYTKQAWDRLGCLRELEPDADPPWTCVNDHTGCMWNDGHNGCHHEGNNTQPLIERGIT